MSSLPRDAPRAHPEPSRKRRRQEQLPVQVLSPRRPTTSRDYTPTPRNTALLDLPDECLSHVFFYLLSGDTLSFLTTPRQYARNAYPLAACSIHLFAVFKALARQLNLPLTCGKAMQTGDPTFLNKFAHRYTSALQLSTGKKKKGYRSSLSSSSSCSQYSDCERLRFLRHIVRTCSRLETIEVADVRTDVSISYPPVLSAIASATSRHLRSVTIFAPLPATIIQAGFMCTVKALLLKDVQPRYRPIVGDMLAHLNFQFNHVTVWYLNPLTGHEINHWGNLVRFWIFVDTSGVSNHAHHHALFVEIARKCNAHSLVTYINICMVRDSEPMHLSRSRRNSRAVHCKQSMQLRQHRRHCLIEGVVGYDGTDHKPSEFICPPLPPRYSASFLRFPT